MEQERNRAVGCRDGLGGDLQPVSVPTHPVTYEKMLPCPYCSDRFPVLERQNEIAYRVRCRGCRANGSMMSNPFLAITFWNNVARNAAS